ncbi:hypothetical protein FB45DRAFT_1092737 [Roridomyces roridus]|uniref:Uncharacterized protein n=1 Tax=Roridomyces roridus TaxID=1738132 RepID=A0AAD7FHZ0_9AGAR|nr:hypothetical protein FB45DRAFT_1092737 [Roridomyces roridus]
MSSKGNIPSELRSGHDEYNPFTTGSLVEALAEPSSAVGHIPSPARPIRPRKVRTSSGHSRRSSSSLSPPSSPGFRRPRREADTSRERASATAAALRRALSVRQGPSRASPPPSLDMTMRQPLGPVHQAGDVRLPSPSRQSLLEQEQQQEQRPLLSHPRGRAHRERRVPYPCSTALAPRDMRSRGIYQMMVPVGAGHGVGRRGVFEGQTQRMRQGKRTRTTSSNSRTVTISEQPRPEPLPRQNSGKARRKLSGMTPENPATIPYAGDVTPGRERMHSISENNENGAPTQVAGEDEEEVRCESPTEDK